MKDTLDANGIRYHVITKPRKKGKPVEIGILVTDRRLVVPTLDDYVGYIKAIYPGYEIVNLWAHTDTAYCIHDATGQWLTPVRKTINQ